MVIIEKKMILKPNCLLSVSIPTITILILFSTLLGITIILNEIEEEIIESIPFDQKRLTDKPTNKKTNSKYKTSTKPKIKNSISKFLNSTSTKITNNQIDENLVHYWNFDYNLIDKVSGKQLKLRGAEFTSDRNKTENNSIRLNRTYLEISNEHFLKNDSFFLSFWIKFIFGKNHKIKNSISKIIHIGSSNPNYFITISYISSSIKNTLLFSKNRTNFSQISVEKVNLINEKWYHVLLSWEGNSYFVFLDGQNISDVKRFFDSSLNINQLDNSISTTIELDELRLFNRSFNYDQDSFYDLDMPLDYSLTFHMRFDDNLNEVKGAYIILRDPGNLSYLLDRFNLTKKSLYINGNLNLKPQIKTYFAQGITISSWIKIINHKNNSYLIDFAYELNKNRIVVMLSKNNTHKLFFKIYGDNETNEIISSSILKSNEWQHIAITLSAISKICRIYINGQMDASSNFSLFAPIYTYVNFIGKTNWTTDSKADYAIDELKFFNRSLTKKEISILINDE